MRVWMQEFMLKDGPTRISLFHSNKIYIKLASVSRKNIQIKKNLFFLWLKKEEAESKLKYADLFSGLDSVFSDIVEQMGVDFLAISSNAYVKFF